MLHRVTGLYAPPEVLSPEKSADIGLGLQTAWSGASPERSWTDRVDSGSAAARVPVAPGRYTVKLTAGSQTLTQTVEVKPDPRWDTETRKRLAAALKNDPEVRSAVEAQNVPPQAQQLVMEYTAALIELRRIDGRR